MARSTYNVDGKIINMEGNEINNPSYDAIKSGRKEFVIAVPLECRSNFRRVLKMPLITCEVSLILTLSRECVITSMERRVITNTRRGVSQRNALFQITDIKLYVKVVTLSTGDDDNFLEQLKSGLKRTIK